MERLLVNQRFSSLITVLAASAAALASLSPTAAHAQFNLVNGTDQGILELASRNTAAGGANANFRADGLMTQAGGGYNAITTVNTGVVNTGLIALPAARNSGAVGNFGGGSASLFSVSGNSCGIFTNSFSFIDNNAAGAGVASESAMYGQGQWTYGGPNGVFLGGAYLSMTAFVDSTAIGSYAEAGVDALFTVTRGGVTVQQSERFIAFGFDGVNNGNGYAGGPLASFISADRYVYQTNALGNGVTFSAASYVGLALNTGDVLTIQGTLTAFGDPSNLTYNTDNMFNNGNDDTGVTAAPEPGSVALALSASVPMAGLVLRRRRRG